MKLTKILLFIVLMSNLTMIYGQNTLKSINPTFGFAPDISSEAIKNNQRNRKLYEKLDSIVNSYKDYETAKKHLSKSQLKFYTEKQDDLEFIENEDYFFVGEIGCSWYCGGGPDKISATSELKPVKNIDYKAPNIHDFSLRTAWVEGVKGLGLGQSIIFEFEPKSPPVTTVKIYNGYMKSEKTWKDNARVKTLKLYINDNPIALLNLADDKDQQIFKIGSQQGVTKKMLMKFEIIDIYKGDKYEDVAISELEFDGTGVHCFAAGTKILTMNNQSTNIENLKIGDKILTFNELTKEIEEATILELTQAKHHNLFELDFEGTKIVITDDHPIFIDNEFYALTESNIYEGMTTKKLEIGKQISILYNGEKRLARLSKIKKIENCLDTYTITKLDKNRLFYANGICVGVEDVTILK